MGVQAAGGTREHPASAVYGLWTSVASRTPSGQRSADARA